MLWIALASPALANHNFDTFDHGTFQGSLDVSGSIPYTAASTYTSQTPLFNSTTYSVQDDGPVRESEKAGCFVATNPDTFHFGGKTAWVRFIVPVAGRVRLVANTPNYVAVMGLFQMNDVRLPGGYNFVDLQGPNNLNCASGEPPVSSETIAFTHVEPNKTLFAWVGGFYCSKTTSTPGCPSTDNANNAPGGETSVHLTFVPDDADGDFVPDTRDQCVNESASTPSGCPDDDLDGTPNHSDQCPTVRGDPPTGCPPADVDGDGVVALLDCNDSDASIRPGVSEILNNEVDENCDGSRGFDRDGDNALAGSDCDDNNRAVRPGAPRIPGNRLDDDCDGQPEPFPVVHGEAVLSYRDTARGIKVRSLLLHKVTPGSRIQMGCKIRGKQRCKQRSRVAPPNGRMRIARAVRSRLAGKRLPAGAVVVIRMAKSGHIGKYIRYKIRRASFRKSELCMPAGSSKPLRRCPPAAF